MHDGEGGMKHHCCVEIAKKGVLMYGPTVIVDILSIKQTKIIAH